MADKEINDLTDGGAAVAGDIVHVVRSGNSRKVALNVGASAAATPAASTSTAGIVELATLAETLAGTDTSRAVVPANLYFPTGHLYGLTLLNTPSPGDTTNDIDIAAGSARDSTDSANMILASALTKQLDAAWAVGTNQGGLDTGSVGNSRYAVWLIKRSDTGVVDALFSTSFSSPTMPTNYDAKVLLGEFTRAAGVNGTPLWYGAPRAATGYEGINLAQPVATTSGTSKDFTDIPAWVKRITVMFNGVSVSGTSNLLVQIGAGSISSSGYSSAASYPNGPTAASSTAGFLQKAVTPSSSDVSNGMCVLSYMGSNTWTQMGSSCEASGGRYMASAGVVTLGGALDRIRLTTVNGTDTFDAGTVSISYE